jgi:predicted kinase
MSKTLYMTKGLPASGKSTAAKTMASTAPVGSCKIVNKDQLRLMLNDGKWSKANEKFVLSIRDCIVLEALNAGLSVIVDDTNLAPKHETQLRALAKLCEAKFEVMDFTHVTVEECIERDRKRPNYVGERVIKDMAKQFLSAPVPVITYDPALPDCIIVDIDGTVALMNGRGPYDRDKVGTDIRNEPVCQLLEAYAASDDEVEVLFVSGRDARCRDATVKWLLDNLSIVNGLKLYMRPSEDTRKDSIIKEEIYDDKIKGKYNVRFVLDDRLRVVKTWRSLGLTCLQVADGDF